MAAPQMHPQYTQWTGGVPTQPTTGNPMPEQHSGDGLTQQVTGFLFECAKGLVGGALNMAARAASGAVEPDGPVAGRLRLAAPRPASVDVAS
eukprot:13718850-Alexandrium_andersonii.AAC.1